MTVIILSLLVDVTLLHYLRMMAKQFLIVIWHQPIAGDILKNLTVIAAAAAIDKHLLFDGCYIFNITDDVSAAFVSILYIEHTPIKMPLRIQVSRSFSYLG